MSSNENNTSYYCPNYILSLWICIAVYLPRLHYGGQCFHFDVLKTTHKTNKEGWKGRRERGVLAAFSAAWINKQRHANEWRTSVIIYQPKDGGLWEIGTRRKEERIFSKLLFRKYLSSNNYLKPVSSPYAWKLFFAKPILLMLRVNIPCVANTVISRTVHTVTHVFHVFACRKRQK